MAQITHTLWSRPVAQRSGTDLVVALHGRGANEEAMIGLGQQMPDRMTLVALRGPIELEPGAYTWFDNRGIGRPIEESIKDTATALLAWLDAHAGDHRRLILLGFSGGTAMSGGLLFTDPHRFAAAVLVSGTLPWEAGLDASAGRLAGLPIFWSIDPQDEMIPRELAERSHAYLIGDSGAEVREKTYPGIGHAMNDTQLHDIVAFLTNVRDVA